MAMLAATVAFSIDAMLPALPQIGAELTPGDVNRAQLIVTSFVLGMGIGTFFSGPLSDRFGRKPVVMGGALLYVAGALGAYISDTLYWMLAARVLQGLGASGPRVASLAMIRDLYSGPRMAQILSFVLMVFSLVPALAPLMAVGLISVAGWRSIFLAFIAFSAITLIWLGLRQPETLATEKRASLNLERIWHATLEVLRHPTTRLSICVQTLGFAMLFIAISTTQPVFDLTYGWGHSFHFWFGGIAVVAASSSIINARFVMRYGMRAIIKTAFTIQIGLSLTMALAVVLPLPLQWEFPIYVLWTLGLFYQAGLTIGNLNALALEPMGHIAGVAASVVSAISTIGAAVIAAPIGLMFNGTPLPMAVASMICAAFGAYLTNKIRRPTDT